MKYPYSHEILLLACRDAMMLELAKFYDEDRSSKSIINLIKKCMKSGNLGLFNDQKKVLEELNKSIQEIEKNEFIRTGISVVKFRRDKFYAHNDEKFFVDQAKDDSHLPMYIIWMMTNFIKHIIYFLLENLVDDERQIQKSAYNNELKN